MKDFMRTTTSQSSHELMTEEAPEDSFPKRKKSAFLFCDSGTIIQ